MLCALCELHTPIMMFHHFLVPQMVKNLPAIQETHVQSLGQEDHLEKGMTIRSSTLAWRNPMDRGEWRATVQWVPKKSDTTEAT